MHHQLDEFEVSCLPTLPQSLKTKTCLNILPHPRPHKLQKLQKRLHRLLPWPVWLELNSEHVALIDADARLVIACIVKAKLCTSSIWTAHSMKKDIAQPVWEHKCNIDHVDSACSTEPKGMSYIVVDSLVWQLMYSMFEKCVIMDYDSSNKAKWKWNNQNSMINNNTTETSNWKWWQVAEIRHAS